MGRAKDPMTALRRALPKATRLALEETFRLWLQHYAPLHFERRAFGRYPEYMQSAKADMGQWLSRHARDVRRGVADRRARPIVRTRRFRNAFLGRGYRFTGSYTRLSVRWSNLPRYATLRNRYSGFQPARAAVAWTQAEYESLRRAFAGWVLEYMSDLTALKGMQRSYGKAVFVI